LIHILKKWKGDYHIPVTQLMEGQGWGRYANSKANFSDIKGRHLAGIPPYLVKPS